MKYNKIKKKTKNLNIKFEYSYINLEILKDLGPYCAIILNFINLLSKNDKFNGYIPIEWVKEQTNFSVNTIRKSLEILKKCRLIKIQRSKNGVVRFWNKISLTEYAKKTYKMDFTPRVLIIKDKASIRQEPVPSWYENYKNNVEIQVHEAESEEEIQNLIKTMF